MANKNAVVTGGESGIGAGIAWELARTGHNVAILFWDKSDPKETRKMCDEIVKAHGVKAISAGVDVRSADSIKAAFAEIDKKFDHINLLINSAGVNTPMKSVDVTESLWDDIMDTGLKGSFFCSQEAAKRMIAQGGSTPQKPVYSMVNIASQIGLVGLPRRAAYCSAKAGVINMTRTLALEWAEHGIRVNAVAPTTVETAFTKPYLANADYRDEVLSKIPQGVIGSIEDVASAVCFLLSEQARIITGQTLAVDGGYTAI